MKEAIHPKYFDVEARCACGATWKTRSTKSELHLEICSNCHPFFTGRQKLIDTEGRVERFTKRFGLDMLRFTNSGTESTMYAIRVARAVTGKKAVIKLEGGYHGGYDPLQAVRDQLSTNHDLSTKEGNKIAAQEFGMMLQVAQQAQDESQLVQLAQSLP